jgi:hypothetical protein
MPLFIMADSYKFDKLNKAYRGKYYVSTIFDYDSNDLIFDKIKEQLSYFVYGQEICPETKRKHLQCYFAFKQDMRWTQVRDIFSPSFVNGKSKYSTHKQCSEYCKKDGSFIEYGELPLERNVKGGEATKKKWEETWLLAKKGDLENIDKSHLIPYYNTINKIRRDYAYKPKDLEYKAVDCPNIWVYGPTRTGKSYFIRNNEEYKQSLYLKPCNKWWCNYEGEQYVLIEDIGIDHNYLGYHLKIWGDRYTFRAEVKGASVVLRPKAILVTSNYHPSAIWSDKNILDPILERFKLIYMHKKWEEPLEIQKPVTGGYNEDDIILNQTCINIPNVNEIKEFSYLH